MRRGGTRGLGRKGAVSLGWALGGAVTAAIVIVSGTAGQSVDARTASGVLRTTTTTAAPAPTTTTTTPPPAPTTTVPPARPAAAPVVPSTTAPPTPPPARRGILPPSEPPANIAPSPDFLQSCSGTHYDDSATCVQATLAAIAKARATEGLPPMSLPSNWSGLGVEEQLFVITNLERTVRGLPALTAMATALDQASAQGAAQGVDPSPPQGFPYVEWGSNWAGAVGNPLEAMYYWMYDDGLGSSNIDCTQSNQSGCWGHRNNVLLDLPCRDCVMGTGYDSTGWQGDPSLAELLVETTGQPAISFTWAQEQPYFS
jgi:hypothetical protein